MSNGFDEIYSLVTQRNLHRVVTFYAWFFNAVVKSAIFRGLAERHYGNGDYISAAICFYYFRFHISMGTLFLAPELAPPRVQCKLAAVVGKPDADPSKGIQHDHVADFLSAARDRGLVSARFVERHHLARDIRDFFNYGPRLHVMPGGRPKTMSCQHSPSRLGNLLGEVDAVVDEIAQAMAQIAGPNRQMAGEWLRQDAADILGKAEFGYSEWCPSGVVDLARATCNRIADKLESSATPRGRGS
jgi:hypothetical protein